MVGVLHDNEARWASGDFGRFRLTTVGLPCYSQGVPKLTELTRNATTKIRPSHTDYR